MKNLKNNINHYMNLKGIQTYSQLLSNIAYELGIKGEKAYEFASKEKSNFSKMLNGERPLKYDFIIPLEKIFGVSLARLTDEDAYKLPAEKENIPFDKGFRYYAYLDDPELYRNEFDLLLAKDATSITKHIDEFGKTFIDYLIEYHSVNGVRYLYEEYGIKLRWYHNRFEFKKDPRVILQIDTRNCIEFARLVASMNDIELFNDIYDSYNMFFSNGYYDVSGYYNATGYYEAFGFTLDDPNYSCIFCNSDYLELLLDNDGLFNSLFKEKPYETKLTNSDKRKKHVDSITYHSINPIINNCLRHALKHLDKYKQQAITILKFGIKYNMEKATETNFETCYVCNELGGLKSFIDNDYYDLIIFVDVETNDDEINSLIEQLPKWRRI